jgi:intracellular septation protein A
MDRLTLFKQMLPGLLPLFIFIAADEIWGTEIGLYVALGFGVIELLITYIKDRKIDRFILSDTLLLVAMGGVSILLENDIFFKLKPALIEAIICVILGISAFTPRNIMYKMSARYLKGMHLTPEAQEIMFKQMRRMCAILFAVFTAHTILIIYSAYFMSKEAWAFISGGLFYIIFGVYMLGQIVWVRLKKRKMMQ